MPGPSVGKGISRELRVTDHSGEKARLWNREHKLLWPPVRGQWSVYLDASLRPKVNLEPIVEEWLSGHEIALMKHPHRDCAYDEIDACVNRGKITAEQGEKMRSHLMLSGHPKNYGLWACGMIARRTNSNLCRDLGRAWWAFVHQIPRDQIWLPLVVRQLGIRDRIRTVEADIFNNEWLEFRRHRS